MRGVEQDGSLLYTEADQIVLEAAPYLLLNKLLR